LFSLDASAARFADIVWSGLLFEGRAPAWWVIIIGLLLELPFVRLVTRFPLKRCILADLAMNAVSTAIGLFLLPILGFSWMLVVSSVLHGASFDLVHWAGVFVLVVVANASIELGTLRFGFRQEFSVRGFRWLCAANSLSVALSLWAFFRYPPRP
jgi:hypothetical protein